MKFRIPNKLIIILFLAIQLTSVSLGQRQLPFLLSQAQTLQEKSDHLIAAKIFKFVASRATDATLIADAKGTQMLSDVFKVALLESFFMGRIICL